jgi:uncharacterized membrane protein YdjX (TVP38/TMEM64 family)
MNTSLRILAGFLLLGAISLAVIYREQFDIDAIQQWLDDAGMLAPVIFILVYALATVLFLPGSVITLAGGALFGPVFGTLYNLAGATLGASLAFLLSRYLAADWVRKKSRGKLEQLIAGVEKEGWKFIAFVRLVPLFPFNLLNYALGLTRIPLLQYALVSFIFMLPGGAAYTYLGYLGREAASGGESLVQKIIIGIALLAMAIFLPGFIKRMRAPTATRTQDTL